MITLDEVAKKLIKEGLHLTALELQAELLRNQGQEVPTIRDFFSKSGSKLTSQSFSTSTPLKATSQSNDDGKFGGTQAHQLQVGSRLDSRNRSPSMQTFDSLDLARCSDDGAENTSEKIALLEFELRKAKETIKSLRSSLTEATTIAEESGSTTVAAGVKSENNKVASKENNATHGC